MTPPISPFDAAVLGVIEGLTEFLPVSSTGHLILAGRALGLDQTDRGVSAFEIVIQSGALLAVIGMYRAHIAKMIRGLLGKDPDGLKLALQLIAAFIPAVIFGLALNDWIKANLFKELPVIAALAVGGAVMIGVEWWRTRRAGGRQAAAEAGMDLAAMTYKAAIIIGCAQCLAMWPGTSRSMATIIAALLLGFSPRAAAEFSFLLALPTLGAATVHDLAGDGPAILEASGWPGLAIGFLVSCVVAWLAVKGFLAYLNKHGLAAFGWYRLALAVIIGIVVVFGAAHAA